MAEVWIPKTHPMLVAYSATISTTYLSSLLEVLCEAPAMQTADAANLWGQLLQALLAQMDNDTPAASGEVSIHTHT